MCATVIYLPTPTGFRVYVRYANGAPISPAQANSYGWQLNWTALPTAANRVETKYYHFAGQRIAMKRDGILTYLHSDHLGSAVLETNASGQIVADQRYYAYGKQRDSGPVGTDRRFTGQKQDASGLVYMNARYYDPVLGQFISPDTLVPDAGLLVDYNRFMYARGNPLKFTDPSGHCATLSSGEADLEGDGECWQLAYQIYGFSSRESFARDWKISGDEWLEKIAKEKYADVEYLKLFAEQYYTEWAREVGLPVAPVQWHPVVNRPVRPPGSDLVDIVIDDVTLCHSDWTQCGRLLDDASIGLSMVAMGCGVGGIAPCAVVASTGSTLVSAGGTAITIINVVREDANSLDVGVAGATTVVGGIWGAKPKGTGIVGFVVSVIQWVWDH